MNHGTAPTSFPIPAPLLTAFASGNCVAFVGAGFSGAAKFPQWGALLEQIASDPSVDAPAAEDRVKSLVQRGSAHALDQAAQLLEMGPIEPQLAELEGRDLSAYGALQQPPAVRDKKRARVFDPTWSAVVVSGHTKHADKKDFVAPNRICLHSATCELQPLHAVLLPARAHLGADPAGDFFQVGWDQ